MNARIAVTALLLAPCAALPACGDANPVAPQPPALAPRAALASRGNTTQQVTGHSNISFVFGPTVIDDYSFSAIRHSDGSYTGQFEFRAKYLGVIVRAHGEVLCFSIFGNHARLGGVVTQSTFPAGIPPGSELTWSVTDNNDRGANTDDTASSLLGSAALLYCNNGLPYPEYPVGHGEIQIHP